MKAGVAREEAECAVREQWDAQENPDTAHDDFKVLRENWDAVLLFRSLRNRWQIHGFSGQRTGLLATEIRATMEMMGFKRKRHAALLEQIEVMEDAALEVWAQTGR